jgi:two-component system, LuxR family, response regulator FixJ
VGVNDSPRPLVFLIDDEPDVLSVLTAHLERGGYDVRGFSSAEQFLDGLSHGSAGGCVVTDVNLPQMNGLALISALAERGSTMPIIVITGQGDVPLAVRAMQAGAVDFLEKPISGPAIRAALGRALENATGQNAGQDATGQDATGQGATGQNASGQAAIGQSALRRERAQLQERLATLSRRERDMFDGLVSGRLLKQVAHDLGISPRTAEIYRAKMMEKLGLTTVSELQRAGIMLELFRGEEG